jgi:uncharacterized membrane protein
MLLRESVMATAQIFVTSAYKKHEVGLHRIWSAAAGAAAAAGNGVGSVSSSGGVCGGSGGNSSSKTPHFSERYSPEKDVFK